VSFPEIDGRRSTSAAARAILADAAAPVDAALAERIAACRDWRNGYVRLMHELTAQCGAGVREPILAAERGLASLRERMVFARGEQEVPLERALVDMPARRPAGSGVIAGSAEPLRELGVPYRGAELRGAALTRQLERWVEAGVVEPSFASSINLVAEHPEWLSLEGRTVVLFGAGAELSPLAPLAAWGARVAAVDLPRERIWDRIGAVAESGGREVTVPIGAQGRQGADMLLELPELRRWVADLARDDELVLGMYAYADGGAHVRLSAAFDALAVAIAAEHPGTALAFLGTPTDAYVVDEEIVAQAHSRYAARRARKLMQAPLQLGSGGRLFTRAYQADDDVADVLIKQQGPNYAFAKRVQRWRALLAQQQGQRVSFNVAPASWTRSVTSNRVLGAAYAGAGRHGVEVFAPATTRVLMAAMLVHDLNSASEPAEHPERLFVDGAAHGGLWRAAYEPRSVLGFAALTGLPATLLGRGAPR